MQLLDPPQKSANILINSIFSLNKDEKSPANPDFENAEEDLSAIGLQETPEQDEELAKSDLKAIVSPRTLSSLYWSLANLKVSKTSRVFSELEKAVEKYMDYFRDTKGGPMSLQSLATILNVKINILGRKDITSFKEAFLDGLQYFKFTTDSLLTLKVIIYTLGNDKGDDTNLIVTVAKIYRDIAKDRHNWKFVKQRHVTEIIYALVKKRVYNETDLYADLYEHIRPHFSNLNHQDLSLLIWSFTRIQIFSDPVNLHHANFSTNKAVSDLCEIVSKKSSKMCYKSCSVIKNSLIHFKKYENLSRSLESRIAQLKHLPAEKEDDVEE
jgi:hypothetical protein